ncbi:uncharacterized protein PV07_12513 [Cladophialophora immunda]|uniref:FAD/NAD(P)-binding domain-containing protein n=1 Tax=Cladophialophora immunda TaxID=569365 RepID=A0A0D2ABG9_9EURO|nr:uncharacterized protein PV07_12513 [Cladophialophora immunda]KIW22097.1 hypothetical protein PV07_12513 [Cladophialophora immunda]
MAVGSTNSAVHITNSDVNATNGDLANGTSHAYQYSHHPSRKARPMRIVVIGCGISGIAAVKMFKDRFQGQPIELVIYEKNSNVGGTWFENRYPGCSCDVPSHTYTFSWKGNPYWSRVYVDSTEIRNYFTAEAKAYGVPEHVRFQHRVTEARWNEANGQYDLIVEDLSRGETLTDKAEVLINASGILNSWKWPDLPGLHTFKGTLLHSAHYDTSAKLEGKVVGVIGTGSSGIQIVPQVQAVAKHLHTFHRSATYITPELALELAPNGRDTMYSPEQQKRWADNPEEFLVFRKRAIHVLNTGFETIRKNSKDQRETLQMIKEQMKKRLAKKPELIPLLIPDFALGCRRFTPGDGYLEALCEDNVTVQTQEITEVVSDGLIVSDGTKVELDVLICATGFNTSFCPPFKLIGEDGAVLNEVWKDGPRGYLGFAASRFPNYFMTAGPNAPAAHGTFIPCIEAYIQYAFDVVERLMTENIKSISPKKEAVDDFQEHKDNIVKDLVWTSTCRSWYKNGTVDGKVWGPWPGSGPHFMESISRRRWEDWDYKYHTSNRFQYLADGSTAMEHDGTELSWFIK